MNIKQTIKLSKWAFDNSPRGSECVFVPFVRHTTSRSHLPMKMPWGLKVYTQAGHAIKAMAAQERYWEQGLAPEVGELVRVKVRGSKTTLYGYFTEQIQGKTAEEYIPDTCPTKSDLPNQLHGVLRRLESMGYSDLDEHLENIMLCQRRMRWIAVDFGAFSNCKIKRSGA